MRFRSSILLTAFFLVCLLRYSFALARQPDELQANLIVLISGLGSERIKELPDTIQSFVNYHTRNSFVWGPWKDDKRVQNVDLGDPSSSFAAGNRRNYGAKFDVKAHTAAEWDELIHADIMERIKSVVDIPESRSSSANDE